MPVSPETIREERAVSSKLRLLRAANVVSFLFVFLANVIALTYDPSSTDIHKKHMTYFSPSLIFMLEKFVISEFFIILNLLVISTIHHNLVVQFPPFSFPSSQVSKVAYFVHTPFSMYLGVTWLDVFHNGFMAFTTNKETGKVLAMISAWFLAIIGFAWCITGIFSGGRRDGVFSATIAWCLISIAVNQRDEKYLSVQCAALAIAQLIAIIVVWIRYGGRFADSLRSTRNASREQRPLLGEADVFPFNASIKQAEFLGKAPMPLLKFIDIYSIDRNWATFRRKDHQQKVDARKRKHVYLVTDLALGGELFDRICARGNYYENDAAHLIKTITEAVAYLHLNGIVHRVDLWAIGVITYFLLCGYTPFDREDSQEEMQAILRADYKFEPPEYWEGISPQAKDFIKKLLVVDPSQRLTAEQALHHVWLQEPLPSPVGVNFDLLPNVRTNFDARKTFKKAVDTVRLINTFRNNSLNLANLKKEADESVDNVLQYPEH
ncbi:2451_t:CDS:2 [Gigaspora margarita]|uniref:2451_t:CDS:1 n=1 Tax=Gigaspora margarita TaxID=4874 RepID=A0ABM8W0T9_GIGMA|nr:2451_t:CDS:2 [Gigaspora margarita]